MSRNPGQTQKIDVRALLLPGRKPVTLRSSGAPRPLESVRFGTNRSKARQACLLEREAGRRALRPPSTRDSDRPEARAVACVPPKVQAPAAAFAALSQSRSPQATCQTQNAANGALSKTSGEQARLRRAIVVVAICLVALSALALVKLSKVTTHSEERVELRPGRRTVRHEKWAESNRIVQIRCEDPLVVSVDLFLTQPGMIHFLLEGKMTGESAVILEFASGDTKSIRVRVSSETPGKQPPLRQQDSIARAVELVHLGDRLYGDRHKEDQNWSRASASYDEALACFRQVPFFVFLPEYRTAIEKARTTELEWNGYYEQVWAEFEIAQTRNDVSAARKILERLLRIVTDPNDPRYLRNKTVMEFLYS